MRGQRGNPRSQRGACAANRLPNGSAPVADPSAGPALSSSTPSTGPAPQFGPAPRRPRLPATVLKTLLLLGALPRPADGPAPVRASRLGRTSLAGLLSPPESPRSAACLPVPLLRLPRLSVPPPSAVVWQCLAGPRAGRPSHGSPPLLKRRRKMKFREPLLGGSAAMPGASPAAGLPSPPRGCLRAASWSHPRLLPGRPRPKTPASAGRSPHNASGQLTAPPLSGSPPGSSAARGRTAAAFAELFRAAPRAASNPDALAPALARTREQLDFGPSALHHNTVADRMPWRSPRCSVSSPWRSAHALFHDRQLLFRIRAPNPQTEVPGWTGVRGWEVSSFGFMEAIGHGLVPLGPSDPRTGEDLETSQLWPKPQKFREFESY